MSSFNPQERVELWTNFRSMARVHELILVELTAELDKKDTLQGCTPENVAHRQGEVDGLRLAIALINRKPSEL
jgi:hypothetical protein